MRSATSSLAFLLIAVLSGCTTLPFAVRDRAEDAFRRQNQLSSEFMLVAPEIETSSEQLYESLLQQEVSMLDACRPLNMAAAKRRDGGSTSLGEKRAAIRSLEACEQATTAFADALQIALQPATDP